MNTTITRQKMIQAVEVGIATAAQRDEETRRENAYRIATGDGDYLAPTLDLTPWERLVLRQVAQQTTRFNVGTFGFNVGDPGCPLEQAIGRLTRETATRRSYNNFALAFDHQMPEHHGDVIEVQG